MGTALGRNEGVKVGGEVGANNIEICQGQGLLLPQR